MNSQKKQEKRLRLKKKIRARIEGTAARPRLSVYRSNQFIYAQVIDDTVARTLAQASDMAIKTGKKTERAEQVGKMVAEAALAQKIKEVVFDRNGFKYTGRVKLLADAARKAGLTF
jgi:large subunit ribosomal protein L18